MSGSKSSGSADNILRSACRLLAVRARSRAELRTRLLLKGFPPDRVKRVLDRLERSGWINDALFSRDWARGRVEGRGWGRERVRHELRQKGVAGETVETTIRDLYADQDEAVMAMDHLSRRFRPGSVLSLRDRRRAVGMLLRRGFGLETVEAALQKFEQKDGNHDVR